MNAVKILFSSRFLQSLSYITYPLVDIALILSAMQINENVHA